MQRHHHHRPFCGGPPFRQPVSEAVLDAQCHIEHDVSDLHDALGLYPFLQKLGRGRRAGGAQQVREAVGHDPVVLFGHRPVATAQTGLDVHERHALMVGDQGPRQSRVGVTIDQDG